MFGAQISLNCFHFTSFVTLTFCRLSPFLCFYPAVLTYPGTAHNSLWSTNAPSVPHIPRALRSAALRNVYNHLARASDQPTSFIVAHFFHFSCAFLILRRHNVTHRPPYRQFSFTSFPLSQHAVSSTVLTDKYIAVMLWSPSITHSPITLALSLLRPICISASFAYSVRMPITTGRLFLLYPFASSFFSNGEG